MSTDTDTPEPQSVQEAISANPDRYATPAPESASETAPVDEAPEAAPVTEAPEAAQEGGEAVADTEAEPTAPAEPETESEAADDPFTEFGGRETVEQALAIHKATQSEDGIIQLFIEAGNQLGLGYDKLEALFGGGEAAAEPAQPAEPGEYNYDEDPDRPLTKREFEEAQKAAAAAAQQAAAQQAAAQRAEAAKQRIDSTLAELGVEPNDDVASAVLHLGDKYLPRGETDPDKVSEAVRRGHADYMALIERESQAYLEKKKKASAVPTSPAGAGAPSEPAPSEPQNTVEAIRMARQKLGLSR